MASVRRLLAVLVGVLVASGVAIATPQTSYGHSQRGAGWAARPFPMPAIFQATNRTTTSTRESTAVPPTTAPESPPTLLPAPVPLAGCPVPSQPPSPSPPPPWHPSILVPDAALPPVEAPAPWTSNLSPITGKGMWIWEWDQTENGQADAIVRQAIDAGLHQLWVRVGDSEDGFYGADELDTLVPAAHAAGLAVIAWGFPYLYDPVGDAGWTAQILAWRSPTGQAVDGYSADIERPSEGVDLTAQRVAVYLQQVRHNGGNRLIVATVYPPSDAYWNGGQYPFTTIAQYVDAFAPMIYWECTDPGADATVDIARLSTLRPVHIIGQAYNMAGEGGRVASPSSAEITEFLEVGRRAGAIGASFWVWQTATVDEWAGVTAYPWRGDRLGGTPSWLPNCLGLCRWLGPLTIRTHARTGEALSHNPLRRR